MAFSLTNCKKKESNPPPPNSGSSPFSNRFFMTSVDDRMTQTEIDLALNDINIELGNNIKLHGKNSSTNLQSVLGINTVDYTLDTNETHLGIITLNYNGTEVNNRNRTGSIKLTILNYSAGARWVHAGCTLKIEYLAYKVKSTLISRSKYSTELNGTQFLSNGSGGSLLELLVLKTQPNFITLLTSKNLSSRTITYNSGGLCTYNINRQLTYTIPNNILTCKIEGRGFYNNHFSLVNYGTDRFGGTYTNQTVKPVIWNWKCGTWAPIEGTLRVETTNLSSPQYVTFGTNYANSGCANVWKVEYSSDTSLSGLVSYSDTYY